MLIYTRLGSRWPMCLLHNKNRTRRATCDRRRRHELELRADLTVCSLTELVEDDVTVNNLVLLPFLTVLACRLDSSLATQLLQDCEIHHLGHDELLLEIGMDAPCSLRCFVSLTDRPGAYFVRSRGEEIDEMHHVESIVDDLAHGTGSLSLLQASLARRVRLDVLKFLLKRAAIGDHRATGRVGVDPVENWLQELVLLTAVVPLIHVDREHRWLGRQQHVFVETLNVTRRPILHIVLDIFATLQHCDDFVHGNQFLLPLLEVRWRLGPSS